MAYENKNIYGEKSGANISENDVKKRNALEMIKAGYAEHDKEQEDDVLSNERLETNYDYVERMEKEERLDEVSPIILIAHGFRKQQEHNEIRRLKRLARLGSEQARAKLEEIEAAKK